MASALRNLLQSISQHPWLQSPHSLDTETIVVAVLCICSLLNVVVAVGRRLVPEPKRLAWVISLFCSGLSSIFSVGYCLVHLRNGVWSHNVIYGTDNASYIVCLFFFCVNLLDLVWGCVFYFKYLHPLTTWVHHPLYMILMLFAMKTSFTQGFALFMIEEIPTFLLALGSISPKHRMDAAFGITFFILRILYHGFFTYYFIAMGLHWGLIVFMLLTTSLHLQWFSTWFVKYGLPLLGLVSKKPKAAAKQD